MRFNIDATIRGTWGTGRLLWTHPLTARNRSAAFARWIRWQLGSRLLPGAAVISFVDDTRLLVAPGMTGATGNVYVGLHEFADMAFVVHYLREGDGFLDVGANVGSYTVLAAGVCGADAIAAEPLPATFGHLRANIRLNGLEARVRAVNVGLAAKGGILRFTKTLDTVNHVLSQDESTSDQAIDVPVVTVDELIGNVRLSLMKIDVEGFESEVLAGAARTLARADLRALIVELNGSGARYGVDETNVRSYIESFGFHPFAYDPFKRSLLRIEGKSRESNTLYLRDIEAVAQRVRQARAVRVLDVDL
jgi:FkbM family methyltransferase